MWLPQNNEAVSQQCGSLKLWLPHNNMAASQQFCWLTTMRLPLNSLAASQQWGCLTTMWLPHNNMVASQQFCWLTTMFTMFLCRGISMLTCLPNQYSIWWVISNHIVELQKDFFCPVSRFITRTCTNYVFSEFCHYLTYEIEQRHVFFSILCIWSCVFPEFTNKTC